jgi:tight adherence protein C
MIAALVCGGIVGLGVLFIVRGLFPPRPRLVDALAELRTLPPAHPLVVMDDLAVGFTARFGSPIARALRRMGMGDGTFASVRHNLAILERSPERHLAEKVTVGIFGFFFVPVVAGLLALDGAHLPLVLPIWGAICLGVVGFFIPDLGVHTEASSRRAEFRHGLSAYLDLVVISLAAGGGIETALGDASDVGDGFAFVRLRRVLDDARLAHLAAGEAFGRLGSELGIDELVELSASLALAGAEGARVRSSLQAKAISMRAHELAEAETSDQAATERMSLPLVLLLAGFMVLIGFPALVRVSHGL